MSAVGSEAREKLVAAIHEWYAATTTGEAMITSWYLIASGTGFDADGGTSSHILQDWDADVIQQLGLLAYAASHADVRTHEDEA